MNFIKFIKFFENSKNIKDRLYDTYGCHDILCNDTQHNDTQYNSSNHNYKLKTTLSIMMLCFNAVRLLLCSLSFILSVIYYAECNKQGHYGKCRYGEFRYADCRGIFVWARINGPLDPQKAS